MASYAAYELTKAGFPVQTVDTFASPHPGDKEFANGYHHVVKKQFRYENDLDIVPFLPPTPLEADPILAIIDVALYFTNNRACSEIHEKLKELKSGVEEAKQWDYSPVGILKFITAHDQIVPDSPDLWLHRLDDFSKDFWDNGIEKGFEKIAHAHSCGCDGGYQKGVAPGVCSC